jgi:predicted KAP-like P-loop ATPase
MFHGDQPIEKQSEDLLRRSAFSKRFASALVGSKAENGLVVAIYGPWGSGKSSFKNLVKESLEKQEKKPLMIEFNPWRWSGEDVLFNRFFEEIGKAIGTGSNDTKDALVAQRWTVYQTYFTLGSSIVSSAGKLGSVVWGPAALVAGTGASNIFKKIAQLIGSAHEGLKAQAELSKRNIDEVRSDLIQALQALDREIIIFVDDIDRLNESEIRLLFQLIKANANFPKVVFVLLFQRDLIEKALDQGAPSGDGAAYLEKIIQTGIDLPQLKRSDLEKILFSELDKILDTDPKTIEQWKDRHQNNWDNLYHGGFKHFFTTIRQVYRYANSLAFLFAGYKAEQIEVDPVDLMALEAIRVFEPKLFQEIAASKETLVGFVYSPVEDRGAIFVELKKRMLATVPDEKKKNVEEILKFLFPVFSAHDRGDIDANLRNKRLCHESLFDRYFAFGLQETDLTEGQIQEIVQHVSTSADLTKKLRGYIEQSRVDQLLEAVEAYKETIQSANCEKIITSFFDIGDAFYNMENALFNTPAIRAYRIVRFLLKDKIQDLEKKKGVFKAAVQASDGLFLPIRYLYSESGESDRTNYPDVFAFPIECLDELKEAVCKKISEKASDGLLQQNPALIYILFAWHEWGDKKAMQDYVASVIDNEGVLERILKSSKVVTRITTIGEHASRHEEEMNVAKMDRVGVLAIVAETVEKQTSPSDELKKLFVLFKSAKAKFDQRSTGSDIQS